MFSERIRNVMDPKKILLAAPDTSVSEASKLMARKRVSAVMIVEAGSLVGIFTERDAVFRVIARGRNPKTTLLRDVMTRKPKTVRSDDLFGYALLIMHENGFRHLPVFEGDTLIGIISARNALDPDLEEFAAEARRRSHMRRRP